MKRIYKILLLLFLILTNPVNPVLIHYEILNELLAEGRMD